MRQGNRFSKYRVLLHVLFSLCGWACLLTTGIAEEEREGEDALMQGLGEPDGEPDPERPLLELYPTAKPPLIDGKLDDPCWRYAPVINHFRQVLPVEGDPPTEQTEVRFLYNRNYLFIGIRCFDREPNQIRCVQMQHDASLSSEDFVKVALDTFDRQRDGYFFAVNPAGVRVEGQIQNFAVENRLWDTVWEAKARIDNQGWTAELAIPFTSLSFDSLSASWGCNIERTIRRKQEVVRWTGLSPAKPTVSMADFGELRGLMDLRQGRGLEFKPFTSVKYTDDATTRDRAWYVKPGFDLTYSITPSLTAQGTFNTDFAEAEVDERKVNLTRFPLFFPEKRDFFLRDAPLFSFGGLDYSPLPYYSRRIGLGPDGAPVDISGGGRVTGRIGGTSVALLDVQQEAQNEVSDKNLAVARLTTEVLNESNAGLIVTHGDPLSNGDHTLGGVDFNYLNSRLPNGRQFVGHAYFMGSGSDRLQGNDVAFGADLDYPNEPWDIHATFHQNGEKFDPALGFIERRGIRDYRLSVHYLWRPNTAWLRSISVGTIPDFTTDLDNRIVAEDYDFPTIDLTTPAGDTLYFDYSFNGDRVDEPFEIWPGIILPEENYRWNGYRLTLSSSDARPITADFSHRGGTFYNGRRTDYFGGLGWRPSRYFMIGGSYELRHIDLNQGRFDVHLASARLNVNITPNLIWNNLVQYDNNSNLLGLNSRLRWTFHPGDDLFLVLNHNYTYEDWRLTRAYTEIAIKLGLTFRF